LAWGAVVVDEAQAAGDHHPDVAGLTDTVLTTALNAV
jgi:hypothetical protein